MKSIIEQASSIMKAIEKAWDQAEQPKEFSIKIFEKEEKNFFGITTKPAKIGIFFGDKQDIRQTNIEKTFPKLRSEIKECRPENRPEHKPKPSPSQQSSKSETHSVETNKNRSTQPKISVNSQKNDKIREQKPQASYSWNESMISATHNWLKKTLALMGMPHIGFTSEVVGKNLKLVFNIPLINDPVHEKQLFRSFAHLIISSLRNQYKHEIKNLKVILVRPE